VGAGGAVPAALKGPAGLAIYSNELYIAESEANLIRKVNLSTNATTTVVSTTISFPYDVAFNSAGDMFIASWGDLRIYKYDGTLTVVAGGGTGAPTSTGVPATSIDLGRANGLVFDASGQLYYAAYSGFFVNRIDDAGIVHRVAGTGSPGTYSNADDATSVALGQTSHLAIDRTNGFLYISDIFRVFRVTLNAVQPPPSPQPIVHIAGAVPSGGIYCCNDGLPAKSARLQGPEGMSVLSSGDLLIADRFNHRIREFASSTSVIKTVMGSGEPGSAGNGLPPRGVHLTLEAPGFVASVVPVNIGQSVWEIYNLSISQTLGVPFSSNGGRRSRSRGSGHRGSRSGRGTRRLRGSARSGTGSAPSAGRAAAGR
jgi:hypothetical protein